MAQNLKQPPQDNHLHQCNNITLTILTIISQFRANLGAFMNQTSNVLMTCSTKVKDYTLCALTLFNPSGKRLLEVLVLLECDGGAHLGGQYHLCWWGSLT